MGVSWRPVVGVAAVAVALPAVTLTLARLAGGSHRQVAVVQAFAPWAIPAYGVVLLLLGTLLIRRAAQSRSGRVVGVAAALTFAALLLHLSWIAPAVLGSPPAADAASPRLTVMTANLHFGEGHVADVADAVADHNVDLLVLQEVTPAALARLEQSEVGTDLPHLAGEPGDGAAGTVVLSRTAVTDVSRIDTVMGSWALTTEGLRVLAVHPAYPLDGRWGAELATIRDAVEAERPDVVAGDFNASRDHAPMRAILDTGLSDAAALVNAGWQPTWPTAGFSGWPIPVSVAIDHVLVGADLTATDTTTVRIGGTDHRALVADLARREQ